MHITENPISPLSDMDGFLDDTEVNIALQAIGFEAQVHPGYDPRCVCVCVGFVYVFKVNFKKKMFCCSLFMFVYAE